MGQPHQRPGFWKAYFRFLGIVTAIVGCFGVFILAATSGGFAFIIFASACMVLAVAYGYANDITRNGGAE